MVEASSLETLEKQYEVFFPICSESFKTLTNYKPSESTLKNNKFLKHVLQIFLFPSNPKKKNGYLDTLLIKDLIEISSNEAGKILDAFLIVNRLSRDIRKIIEEIRKNTELGILIKEKKFEILKIGKASEHAELKILTHILPLLMETDKNKFTPIYIGISKLCCTKCEIIIQAINETLLSSEDVILRKGCSQITFSSWIKPAFLKKI